MAERHDDQAPFAARENRADASRTRAFAINEHNQIIGDNCFQDCGLRAGLYGSTFAVIWTLKRG